MRCEVCHTLNGRKERLAEISIDSVNVLDSLAKIPTVTRIIRPEYEFCDSTPDDLVGGGWEEVRSSTTTMHKRKFIPPPWMYWNDFESMWMEKDDHFRERIIGFNSRIKPVIGHENNT